MSYTADWTRELRMSTRRMAVGGIRFAYLHGALSFAYTCFEQLLICPSFLVHAYNLCTLREFQM